METDELKTLCEKVASNLSGHPTKVYFQQPARTDAKAETGKRNGQAFINIVPGLFYRDFLNCLVHESAHIKQLWSGWNVDLPEYKPGTVNYPAWTANLPVVKKIEKDADCQAELWMQYADNWAYFKSGDWLLIRLNALLAWKAQEPDLGDMIKKTVEKTLTKAIQKRMVNNGYK